MKKIKTKMKKQITKAIGKQFKKVIAKNVDAADPSALNGAAKLAEEIALKTFGIKATANAKSKMTTSKTKSKEFKIKIKGMEKAAWDALKGAEIDKALKERLKVEVRFTYRF